MTTDEYCRELEAHLCRRNGGHLVRVVGPAFEMVCGWHRQGIPLKVAMQGIDRRVARAEARGGRRHPLRLEFCEADVLRAFDEWRRAVGVRGSADARDEPAADVAGGGRRGSLARHIERVVVRLTALRSGDVHPAWQRALDAAVRELDALAGSARRARGEARGATVAALALVDRTLLAAARESVPRELADAAMAEASRQLAPFQPRLSEDAWKAALERGRDAVLRDRLGLPTITFE